MSICLFDCMCVYAHIHAHTYMHIHSVSTCLYETISISHEQNMQHHYYFKLTCIATESFMCSKSKSSARSVSHLQGRQMTSVNNTLTVCNMDALPILKIKTFGNVYNGRAECISSLWCTVYVWYSLNDYLQTIYSQCNICVWTAYQPFISTVIFFLRFF